MNINHSNHSNQVNHCSDNYSSDFYDDHDSENKIKNHLSIKSHKSNKS